eukprot:s740_g13.t1
MPPALAKPRILDLVVALPDLSLELGHRGWESEPCLVVFARCPVLLAMHGSSRLRELAFQIWQEYPRAQAHVAWCSEELRWTQSLGLDGRGTGLRGGGAVFSYRAGGVPIPEIRWRMRLKNLETLEFYLQEVGAVSALTSLDDTSARKIRAAGSLYTHL